MSNTPNVTYEGTQATMSPDYEALAKKLEDRCHKLAVELDSLRKYADTLERKMEKYELVVRCLEVFTGESLDIE